MNLPRLNLRSASDEHRERLARWLIAWEIDLELRAAERDSQGPPGPVADVVAATDEEIPVTPTSSEPAPEPRQIRLFSPRISAARDRLLYVAVLAAAGPGQFLVAPYGRFTEPCVAGELLSGRDAGPLTVLCLWNAAEITTATLAESWVIDRLSANELAEALSVRHHLLSEKAPTPQLAERIGPPLWHPADPRRRYLQEERRVMERLSGGSAGAPAYPTLDPAWPIAADPHDPYGPAPTPE